MTIEFLKGILFCLSSAGYIAFLSECGKIKFAFVPFLYICIVVIVLYVFALLGNLYVGSLVCLIVGFVLGAIVIAYKRKQLKTSSTIKELLWFVLILLPFFLIYRAIPSTFVFTVWDEFTWWGISIKWMYEHNSLFTAEAPLHYKHYPPVQQLFQYYFTKTLGWSEAKVLYAQVIFLLAALMATAGGLLRDKSLLGAFAFITSCAFLYFFGFSFSSIYVDALVAVTFAATVILAMFEKPNLMGTVQIAVAVFVLVLLKQIGLLLSLIVIAIYSINICFYYLEVAQEKRSLKKSTTALIANKALLFSSLVSILVVSFSVLLAFKSWEWYVKSIGAYNSLAIPMIESFFQDPLLHRVGLTAIEFLHKFNEQGFFITQLAVKPSIHTLTLGMAFIGMCAIAFIPRNQRYKNLYFSVVLIIGAVAYEAFLFLAYILFFPEWEGVRMYSFERYSGTYYLGWLLILFAIIVKLVESKNIIYFTIAFGIAICVIAVKFSPSQFVRDFRAITPPQGIIDIRSRISELVTVVKQQIKQGEKVHFISQKSDGFEKAVYNFSMIPYEGTIACWSLGKKYSENDIWTCDRKLSEILREYDYLVIHAADEQFWLNNSTLFEPSAYGLKSGVFKVVRVGENLKLKIISN